MKRLSAMSTAAIAAIISSAGVPMAGAMNHFFGRSPRRSTSKVKSGTTPADKAALAKAEAKRARRAGRNKEPA